MKRLAFGLGLACAMPAMMEAATPLPMAIYPAEPLPGHKTALVIAWQPGNTVLNSEWSGAVEGPWAFFASYGVTSQDQWSVLGYMPIYGSMSFVRAHADSPGEAALARLARKPTRGVRAKDWFEGFSGKKRPDTLTLKKGKSWTDLNKALGL